MGILTFSCQKETKTPEQEEREKVMAVEDLLRDNQWGFYDVSVSVKYESRALPMMVNVADENGMVQPGIYDSYAIFGDNSRQLDHTYEFTRDDIMVDTSHSGESHRIGGYYVVNTSQIRINLDTASAVKFDYVHESEENQFIMSASSIYSKDLIEGINNIIIQMILSGTPGNIAEAFVTFLMENEKVSDAIQQFLYDLIHGRVEEITQSPEEIAEELARALLNKLGEIDWGEVLYDRILEFLQNQQEEDPEEKAAELARRIADKVEASLTKSDIYDVLLPVLENFENETLPVLASQIAAAIYEKIAEALSEENLYDRIYPIWEDFTGVDTVTVTEAADTLAGVVTAHFFDASTLTGELIPFVQKIDETSTFKLGGLAQEIIDSVLIPVVENINEAFPGLDLEPDLATVKPIITSVLTALKASLGSSTVEELAGKLAEALIGIMDVVIQKGFEKAIYSLQEIPPDQAASVFASWITNLVALVEQPVVDFIERKLNAVFDQFEAERAAEELSTFIHTKFLEIFSEENLYKITLPLLEAFQSADLEKIADILAQWIIDLGLISKNITEEDLVTLLTVIISDLIGSIDPDQATERLVELILESELVEQIEGNILQRVIESKIYELMLIVTADFNAIDRFEIIISQK
jgi:hypothetical protein